MFPKPEKRKKGRRKQPGSKPSTASRRKLYRVLVRPAYLAGLAAGQGRSGEAPLCERCGEERHLSIHHRAGRVDDALLDARRYAALCDPCHDYCHDHPAQARAEGWMLSRLGEVDPVGQSE